MMGKTMADDTEDAATDPWLCTTSPEQAIHLCSTAFYPHRLTLLGRSNGFGLSQLRTAFSTTMTINTSHEQTASYSPKTREFHATFHSHNAFRENGERKGQNIRRHS
jgi:trans-2-enoyl-CoA reductase